MQYSACRGCCLWSMEQKIGSSRFESVGEVMGDARSSGGAEMHGSVNIRSSMGARAG